MAEVCDLTYLVLLEKWEAWVRVQQTGAMFAMAMGNEGVEMPNMFQERDQFEAMLTGEQDDAADESPEARERREKMLAMGIR